MCMSKLTYPKALTVLPVRFVSSSISSSFLLLLLTVHTVVLLPIGCVCDDYDEQDSSTGQTPFKTKHKKMKKNLSTFIRIS